jgi:hypothetical protein
MPTVTVYPTSTTNRYYRKLGGPFPDYNMATGQWYVEPDQIQVLDDQDRGWVGTDIHSSDNSYWCLRIDLDFPDPGLPQGAVVESVRLMIRLDGHGSGTEHGVAIVSGADPDCAVGPGETGHTIYSSALVVPSQVGTYVSFILNGFVPPGSLSMLVASTSGQGNYGRYNLADPYRPYILIDYSVPPPSWEFDVFGSLWVSSGQQQPPLELRPEFDVVGSLAVIGQTQPPQVVEAVFDVFGSLHALYVPPVELTDCQFDLFGSLAIGSYRVGDDVTTSVVFSHWTYVKARNIPGGGGGQSPPFEFDIFGSLKVIGQGEPPPSSDVHVSVFLPFSQTLSASVWVDRNARSLGQSFWNQTSSMAGAISPSVNLNAGNWVESSEWSATGMETPGSGNMVASATLRATMELVTDE